MKNTGYNMDKIKKQVDAAHLMQDAGKEDEAQKILVALATEILEDANGKAGN